MAQFLYSEIGITDIRGKIGGTQFTRVRSGGQGILPTTPRQAGTPDQQASQNKFQKVLGYWRELEEYQRVLWNEAAGSPDWTRTNRTGEEYQPTGQSLFIQLNLSAFKQSFPIEEPPSYPSFTEMEFDFLEADTTPKVTLYFTASSIAVGESILMYSTAQLSRGRTSVNQRQYFFTDNADAESFSDPWDMGAQYALKWGNPIPGLKIFVQCWLLNEASGARKYLGWKSCIIT